MFAASVDAVVSLLLGCYMNLDCIKASDVGMGSGWVVIDTRNGGIVAHDTNDDCGFAWMRAAEKMAEAVSDIQRTIYALSPQQMAKSN